MMNELVSVVVPVYNTAPWLDRCVESIAAQTHRKLEILLVDDGSTDESPALCDCWAQKDPRIRVIHKKNEGLGMARNTGMDQASGRYLFFFDSDDYIEPQLVENCLARARETEAPVVLYGCCRERQGRRQAVPVTAPKLLFRGEEIRQELLPSLYTYGFGQGVSAWGKMYDLTLLRRLGLRFRSEREIISEDGWFMLELFSRLNRAAILPENLYIYCIRRGSLSRAYRPDRQRRNDGFLEACRDYVQRNGLPEQVAHHIAARYHGMTLGAMMDLLCTGLSRREKQAALTDILESSVLRSTLTGAVTALDAPLPRLFWRCLRERRLIACRVLLQLNLWRRGR